MFVKSRLSGLEQNALYAKRQINRNLISYKLQKLARNDLTYILGARCVDGVVLVADTKITIDEGAKFVYGKKLFGISDSIVMGASGISGFFSSFQNRVQVKSAELTKQGQDLNTPSAIKLLAENVIREMHNVYEQDRYLLTSNFSVFVAIRIFQHAELVNFTGYGIPEPVTNSAPKVIGHGEPYGALFVDRIWTKSMTMEETARLALFNIKLIQDTKIDTSVGFSNDCMPQVYHVPDVVIKMPPELNRSNLTDVEQEQRQGIIDECFARYPIKELTDDEVLCCLNDVSGRVAEIMNKFKQGQFKI